MKQGYLLIHMEINTLQLLSMNVTEVLNCENKHKQKSISLQFLCLECGQLIRQPKAFIEKYYASEHSLDYQVY